MKAILQSAVIIAFSAFGFLGAATPLDQNDITIRESWDGLEYNAWVAKKVADGEFYWANDTETEHALTRDLQDRGVTATIVNAACSVIVGDQAFFEEIKEAWCAWAQDIKDTSITLARAYSTDAICEGERCRLLMELWWKDRGVYKSEPFKRGCYGIFDALYKRCLGGGTAGIKLNDGGKTYEGTVNVNWLEKTEASKTCPEAPKPAVTCKSSMH
ncbi:hypothetical protein F4776DRAFT_639990 [Hypoxylon sp. NC0597]|nr:hypothetical protein F4776DRAFT_639990 [Hypoxylon sp. NC0597]